MYKGIPHNFADILMKFIIISNTNLIICLGTVLRLYNFTELVNQVWLIILMVSESQNRSFFLKSRGNVITLK